VHTKDGSTLTLTGTGLNSHTGHDTPTGPTSWHYSHTGSTTQSTVIPAHADFALTGNFTLEAFVLLNNNTTQGTFISNYSSGNANAVTLGVGSTGRLEAWINGNGEVTMQSTTTMALRQWYHIALVRTGGNTISLYLNGVNEAQISNSVTVGSASYNFEIGRKSDTTLPFNGLISNVRLVNGTGLYSANFTPPSTQLTAVSGTAILLCHKPHLRNEGSAGASSAGTVTQNGGTLTPRAYPGSAVRQVSDVTYTTDAFGGTTWLPGGNWLAGTNSAIGTIGTGDFTIEGWVYVYPIGGYSGLVTSYSNPIGAHGVGIIWETNKVPFLATGANTAGQFSNLSSSYFMQNNRWYHLAASRQSGTLRIFVDGILRATDSAQTVRNITNTNFVIGNYYAGASTPQAGAMFGRVSGVRVVAGTALYTTSFVPSSSPPSDITNTAILYNSGNAGLADASGHQSFIMYNGAALSSTQAKFGATSLSLNGTNHYVESEPSPLLRLLSTSTWTVEAWIYPTALGSTRTFLSLGDGGGAWGTNIISQFSVTSGGELHFQLVLQLMPGIM
jgi:hypothetical protein